MSEPLPPSDRRKGAMDRRTVLMIAAISLNFVLSVTAIALWALSPRPGGAGPRPSSSPAGLSAPGPGLSEPPRRGPLAGGRPLGARASRGADSTGPSPQASMAVRPRGAAAGSSGAAALAQRLNLNPDVLVAQLGDAQGEVPAAAAARLEKAFDAARGLAARRGLDEPRSQSLAAALTYHVFSLLVEENASPGGVDPARIDEITGETLVAIRRSCGDQVASDAEAELSQL